MVIMFLVPVKHCSITFSPCVRLYQPRGDMVFSRYIYTP